MNKEPKQKIIILEAVDGSGKTTIKKAIEVKSNWKYIVIDRFAGSDIVYDNIYHRENREELLFKLEKDLSEIADVYLVYLHCDYVTLMERLKEKNENPSVIGNIMFAETLFEMNYLSKTPLNYIKINTTDDVDNCVDMIIKFVENTGGPNAL